MVLGSSVAAGCYDNSATNGWVGHLERTIGPLGWVIQNLAESGTDTCYWLNRIPKMPVDKWQKVDVVIMSLSLANEGLGMGDPAEVQQRFTDNILRISKLLAALGPKVILGGVYPNNVYGKPEYIALKEVNASLMGIPKECASVLGVIDFLSATDDGKGHWKKGQFHDAGHPNQAGHQAMFSAVPLALFPVRTKTATS